ncbi:MAG: gluconate 2-dehydrogenase subunit 3 family protein [Kordiimonadaceae bacterium]|nr:gluconate 2-dehydrogenase subunit 3 family protein [Kordiimonadaceae bacterium]
MTVFRPQTHVHNGPSKFSRNRRRVLQMIAATGPAIALMASGLRSEETTAVSKGYGKDVDMLNPQVTWAKLLTADALKNVTILCDIIIPEDEKSPAASALDVPDFVNEWVSAPYPRQEKNKETILTGLEFLNAEAKSLYGKQQYHELESAEQESIFGDLAVSVSHNKANEDQIQFFQTLMYIVAGGYYTTEVGTADLGFVGNVPSSSFDGPPQEIRDLLSL